MLVWVKGLFSSKVCKKRLVVLVQFLSWSVVKYLQSRIQEASCPDCHLLPSLKGLHPTHQVCAVRWWSGRSVASDREAWGGYSDLHEWGTIAECPEFETSIFLLIKEMGKGSSDYLQIPKELFSYVEPWFINVEGFNYALLPDIPVCSDGHRHSSSKETVFRTKCYTVKNMVRENVSLRGN